MPNIIVANSLMNMYVKYGDPHSAIKVWEGLHKSKLQPTPISFVCVLQACGDAVDLETGKKVHEYMQEENGAGNTSIVTTALIEMYVKCQQTKVALQLWNQLCNENQVNPVVYGTVLSACTIACDAEVG